MTRLMISSSLLAMTAAERAVGRYMKAPDHPGVGDGDDGGDTAVAEAPEPEGEEINDPVDVDDISGDNQPPEGGDDSPPADGADDEEGDEPKPPEPKADDTAARLAALEQRVQASDQDIAYWKGRAEGTINEDGTPVNPPQDDRTILPDDPDRPNPANYQYGETDAQYITDLAEYAADKAFEKRRETQRVQDELDQIQKTYDERGVAARERYPDYDEVVVKGADVDPATGQPKWWCSRLMSLGMKTSEYGHDIAHYLASNPEESLDIAQMSPLDQAKQFGRLEYMAELKYGKAGEAPTQRHSGAPTPPPRLKGSGGGGGGKFDPEDYDQLEAHADELRKKKGRRNR